MSKEFITKIATIQKDLKAPKGQKNTFGNYNYRNQEDILEAVKPLLAAQGLILTISDEIVSVQDGVDNSRIYVKATATITDGENSITNTAFARESLDKKGMDHSQITGATSSYARKYCLNGLFLIDDTKDADSMDNSSDAGSKGGAKKGGFSRKASAPVETTPEEPTTNDKPEANEGSKPATRSFRRK